eukprot:3245485-Rhodomonas_salina.4
MKPPTHHRHAMARAEHFERAHPHTNTRTTKRQNTRTPEHHHRRASAQATHGILHSPGTPTQNRHALSNFAPASAHRLACSNLVEKHLRVIVAHAPIRAGVGITEVEHEKVPVVPQT